MKLTKFVLLISALGSIASASMEYRAGRNYMWSEKPNGTIGTSIYGFGETSFDNSNLDHIKNLGYTQDIKSALQDKWKYSKNGITGSVTINRKKVKDDTFFDSVIVEGKESGVDWTDVSVFGDGNSLARRTICKDLDCYVVTKSICSQMTIAAGARNAQEAKEMANTCKSISDAFTRAVKDVKTATALEADFSSDMKKTSNTWRSKKMNLGDGDKLGIQNMFGYLQACNEMEWYNKARVETVRSPIPPAAHGTRNK